MAMGSKYYIMIMKAGVDGDICKDLDLETALMVVVMMMIMMVILIMTLITTTLEMILMVKFCGSDNNGAVGDNHMVKIVMTVIDGFHCCQRRLYMLPVIVKRL